MRAAVPVAALGGLALDTAFPAVAWWPMVFVGVAAGLITLIGRRPGGALLVGAVFGASFHLSHLVWVGRFLGPVPWLALAALQTVLFTLGAVAISLLYAWAERTRLSALASALAVSAAWTAREVLMGVWPYSGFPWARLGMSQVNGPFADIASWFGVTGLSFLIAFATAYGVELWRRRPKIRAAAAAVATASIVAVLIPPFPTTEVGTVRVGWVQGNGPTGYFDDAAPGAVFDAQRVATSSLIGREMDVLAWPEGSVETDPLADAAASSALDDLSRDISAPVLVNAATRRDSATYNTTLLWEPGTPTQVHDKMNPVPFGEYVPDRSFYEKLAPGMIGLIQRDYSRGTLPPVVTVGAATIGLAICFDVIYDDVIRSGVLDGAEAFVFQTNNADFRGTDENLQQAAFARMRAIETGRAVVNVSTVGTSQVFAPDGTILDQAEPGEAASGIAQIPRRIGIPPGIVLGPWINACLVASAVILLIVAAVRLRARRTGTPHLERPR